MWSVESWRIGMQDAANIVTVLTALLALVLWWLSRPKLPLTRENRLKKFLRRLFF